VRKKETIEPYDPDQIHKIMLKEEESKNNVRAAQSNDCNRYFGRIEEKQPENAILMNIKKGNMLRMQIYNYVHLL
jgi:hypothetical protein